MNTPEIISLVIGSGIAMRVVEHLLTRKMSAKNVAKSHIENIDLAGNTWQNVVDRLETRIEKLLGQIKDLQDENTTLKEDVYKLREDLVALKYLQKKAEKYEGKIKRLEDKITHYEYLLVANNIEF